MGREIQKKKNRSGLQKIKQRPRSKKRILSNPIIATHWNKKQTLAQNYRRLGLKSRLNGPTGGIERTPAMVAAAELEVMSPNHPRTNHDRLAIHSAPAPVIPPEVLVERDPKTGKILRVIEQPSLQQNHLNDPVNALDDEDEWQGFGNGHAALGHLGSRPSESDVVQKLEAQARNGVRNTPRKQSEREEEWISNLIAKYGEDYGAMSKDIKLNSMQQTEGDLRRRAAKYMKKRRQKS